jgi:hypothetical protein
MLLFFDGFDHYSASTIGGKWIMGGAPNAINTAASRFSVGQGVQLVSGNTCNLVRNFPNTQTVIAGLAIKFNTLAGTPIFDFLDSGTSQCNITITSAGVLQFNRAGSVAIGASYTLPNPLAWHYYEVKMTVTDSTSSGDIQLYIDGVQVLSLAGSLDSKNTANAYCNQIKLFGGISSNALDFDDFYLLDTTGSAPDNTFLGDVRVSTTFPDNNGNYSQFDGSDGNTTNNYQLVDDNPPNSDTDYVESGDVGDRDSYSFSDWSNLSTVFGVQVNAYARKTDAATRQIALTTRMSGTDYDGSAQTLGSQFANFIHLMTTRPTDSAPWTQSDLNGAEFGQKVEA